MSTIPPMDSDPFRSAQRADVTARHAGEAAPRNVNAAEVAKEEAIQDAAMLREAIEAGTVLEEIVVGAEKAQKERKPDTTRVEPRNEKLSEEKGFVSKAKGAAEKAQTGTQKGEELAAQLLITSQYDKLAKKKRADKETAHIYAAMAKALGIVLTSLPENDLAAVREMEKQETIAIAGHYHLHQTAVMLTMDGFLGTTPTIEMGPLATAL